MSNIAFIVPKLRDNGAWVDYRGTFTGGYGWRYDRALSQIKYAVNHHSVTNPSKNAKQDAQTIFNIHKNAGYGGIGYNFLITSEEVKGKDGLMYAKVAYTGDIGSVRAHTANTKGGKGLRAGYGNEDLVAACMIGQLHLKNPTQAQIRSAYWLYRELIQEEPSRLPNLKGTLNNKLTTHADYDPTQCSGNWGWQKPQIVNYKDPAATTVTSTAFNPAKRFKVTASTTLVNIPANTKYTDTIYKAGSVIEDIVEMFEYSDGKKFYRAKYARDGAKKMYGFEASKLQEIVPDVFTTKDITITRVIEHGFKTIETSNLPKDETRIAVQGVDGAKIEIYTVTYKNGVETSRNLKSEKVTQEPVTEITEVGTFVEQPVEPERPVEPEAPDYDKENNDLLKKLLSLVQTILDKITSIFK